MSVLVLTKNNIFKNHTPFNKTTPMNKKIIILGVLNFISFFSFAQNYVSLYDQCNYSGNKYTLEPGNYRLAEMKIRNDRLSSITVPTGMKITIYEHDNFNGKSKTFSNNTPCLDNDWRNMTSSVVIEKEYGLPAYNENDYVTLFTDCYNRGQSQILRPGAYTGSQLGTLKYNISSFIVSGNVTIKLYFNNENTSGYSLTYDKSQSCLPRAE